MVDFCREASGVAKDCCRECDRQDFFPRANGVPNYEAVSAYAHQHKQEQQHQSQTVADSEVPYTVLASLHDQQSRTMPITAAAAATRGTVARNRCCMCLHRLHSLWVKLWKWKAAHEKCFTFTFYSVLLTISATANPVVLKTMIDKMPNYGCFTSQITTVGMVVFFYGLVMYSDHRNLISEEVKRYPKRKFALMGLLDSLGGIVMIIGGVHTSGPLQVMLNQLSIVVSLIASVIVLQRRYRVAHYVGALIIVIGVVVAQLPDLLGNSQKSTGNVLAFNVLYATNAIPISLSSVYKEVAFRGVPLDANYLQAWVAIFQFLFGFLVMPLNSLSILGPEAISLSEIPLAVWRGFLCLCGINSIVTDCGGNGQRFCDTCQNAWVTVTLYFVVNLIYNVAIVLVLKHGGATLLSIIFTFRLPLSALAFSSTFIMGDKTTPLKSSDIWGMLFLLLGMGTYRFASVRKKRSQRRRAHRALQLQNVGNNATVSTAAPAGSGQTGPLILEDEYEVPLLNNAKSSACNRYISSSRRSGVIRPRGKAALEVEQGIYFRADDGEPVDEESNRRLDAEDAEETEESELEYVAPVSTTGGQEPVQICVRRPTEKERQPQYLSRSSSDLTYTKI